MGAKRVYLLIAVCFLLVGIVCAETNLFVPQSDDYNLQISCENNGNFCTASATCNLTINYANSSTLINNQLMSNMNNGYFNYSLNENQTSVKGEYSARVTCIDGTLNDTSTFIYEVNPEGIRPSDQKTEAVSRAVWFLVIFGALLFIAFLFTNQSPPVKWTFFIMSIFFFLMTLNIIFIGIQDDISNPRLESLFDSFTAIAFIMYWFMAGLLIIMWIFTFFNTWILNKNLRNMQKYGLA